MDEQLIALYHRHAATAFDRGARLAALIEQKASGEKCAYDVGNATLSFGKLKFEAPLLGAHASGNDSWLWSWSNRNLKLTITNRALGDLVRVTAQRLTVPMLAHAGFSIEPLLGAELTKHAANVFGSILARELGYDAHYVTAEPGHRSAILVRDDRFKVAERYPLNRVLTLFPKVIRSLPVSDHSAALAAYAHDYSLTVTEGHGTLTVGDGKGEILATFDEHNRLTKMTGTNVSAPPEKKSTPAKRVTAKPPVKKTAKVPKKTTTKKVTAKPANKKPVAAKVLKKKATKPAPKTSAKKPVKKR